MWRISRSIVLGRWCRGDPQRAGPVRCRPLGKGKGKGKGKKKGKKMMRKREARDCFGRCEEDEKFTKEAVAKLNVKRESLGLPVGRVARVEAELKSQLPPTRFPSTVPTSGIVLARHALMECLMVYTCPALPFGSDVCVFNRFALAQPCLGLKIRAKSANLSLQLNSARQRRADRAAAAAAELSSARAGTAHGIRVPPSGDVDSGTRRRSLQISAVMQLPQNVLSLVMLGSHSLTRGS